jgi:hypothetical protein
MNFSGAGDGGPGENVRFTNEYKFEDSNGNPIGKDLEMALHWDESGQGVPHQIGQDTRYYENGAGVGRSAESAQEMERQNQQPVQPANPLPGAVAVPAQDMER